MRWLVLFCIATSAHASHIAIDAVGDGTPIVAACDYGTFNGTCHDPVMQSGHLTLATESWHALIAVPAGTTEYGMWRDDAGELLAILRMGFGLATADHHQPIVFDFYTTSAPDFGAIALLASGPSFLAGQWVDVASAMVNQAFELSYDLEIFARASVPEPSTLLLLALPLACVVARRRTA